MRISDGSSDVCSSDLNASDNKSATAQSATSWTEFRDNFLAGYFPLNPNFAVYQGKHEYDGQLPDWSPEGLEKQAAYLEKTIADAKAFDGEMTDAEKFERDYLIHVAQGQLFFLRDTDFAQKNPAFRSEEHTSELQSLMRISYAVFCLKKKKT